jgi:hypothetical protein
MPLAKPLGFCVKFGPVSGFTGAGWSLRDATDLSLFCAAPNEINKPAHVAVQEIHLAIALG